MRLLVRRPCMWGLQALGVHGKRFASARTGRYQDMSFAGIGNCQHSIEVRIWLSEWAKRSRWDMTNHSLMSGYIKTRANKAVKRARKKPINFADWKPAFFSRWRKSWRDWAMMNWRIAWGSPLKRSLHTCSLYICSPLIYSMNQQSYIAPIVIAQNNMQY